ncbi:MAG: hypothetical protein QXT86_10435 [Archaeoglobaceae archaeon]
MGAVAGALSAIASFLKPVGPVMGALGGIAQIFTAFKASVPKVTIPSEVFKNLQVRIEGLTGISEEARRNIEVALEMYRRGELLPQYKARLDEEFERLKKKAIAQLSARGLLESSVAVEVMAELQRWYMRTYYDLLTTQLRDALSLAGLAEADVRALLTEANAYTQMLQAQAQAMTMGQLLNLGRVEAIKGGFMSLADALSNLGTLTRTGIGKVETGFTSGEMASRMQQMYQTTPAMSKYLQELGRPYYPITGLEERLKINRED